MRCVTGLTFTQARSQPGIVSAEANMLDPKVSGSSAHEADALDRAGRARETIPTNTIGPSSGTSANSSGAGRRPAIAGSGSASMRKPIR